MAYLRARRSVKLGPGVKLNLNKGSFSVSVGGRGAHHTVNSRGRRTTSVGVPGTGVSYVSRSSTRTNRPKTRPAPDPRAKPARPGLFASKYDRAFYDGVQKLNDGNEEDALRCFEEADRHGARRGVLSPALMAGTLLTQLDRPGDAIPYLERVIAADHALPDALMGKYGPGLKTELTVEEGLTVPIKLGSIAAAITLAWCYRDTQRLDDAIGVAQQLHDHADSHVTMLILAKLYAQAGEWDEIVHLTAGMHNEDDITLLLRLQQAQAFVKQGVPEAALEAYRDALKSKKRNEGLLKQARYERAQLHLAAGNKGLARRDLARLYADDPEFRNVADLVRAR